MDVLLREHKVYVDTVKVTNNIKIFRKKRQKILNLNSKLLFKFFFISIDNVSLGVYMKLREQIY